MATSIPPPPRRTGNLQQDLLAQGEWIHVFHKKAILEQELLSTSAQAQAGDFDPSDLPDPATSTVAQAQQTANEAYAIAAINDDRIDVLEVNGLAGSFTLGAGDIASTVVFASAQPDTDYYVTLTPTDDSGSPVANSRVVRKVEKTVDDFEVTVVAPPGGGNTVTFDWILRR